MTTATVLIEGAMRSIGMLKKGMTTDATELADGLELLNQMLGMWTNRELMVPTVTNESLTISSAASSYTIGPSGTLVTTKPIEIKNVVLKYGVTPYTVEERDIKLIRASNTGISGIPSYYYYEPTVTNGTLYFDKMPTVPATLELDSIKSLSTFTAVTTDVTFIPGFDFAVRFNLAVYMAPEYGKAVPAEVAKGASDGMDAIESYTSRNRTVYSRVDDAISKTPGHYKILTDRY